MKKYLIITSLCVFILTHSSAQRFIHDFGKYSNEEFQMNQYEKDPKAEAVVIYDIGESQFYLADDGYRLVFDRKTKIKIFNKAGQKYAQFEIPIYFKNTGLERIEELEGNTYNYEDGIVRTTALNIKNTYLEKESENWMVKKFAMPDVKDGSVIEVRYRISTPYFFNFRSWEFQNKIPVIYSEYVTKMIPFYEYKYFLQGANKFDSFRSYRETGNTHNFRSIKYDNMVYEFIMKDVPAFKDESFITSANDFLIKLEFQLAAYHSPWGGDEQIMTTWPKLIDDMLDDESFGKYLKAADKRGKEITDLLKLGGISNFEKIVAIDKYLKSNFYCDGHNSKFSTKSVKDLIKTKTGNVADINLFYCGILNSIGIEAYPVLLSTRDHGQIRLSYPFHHFFNYVMVTAKIDGNFLLLDATEPMSNLGEIPTQCLNNKGLIIKKDKEIFDWIELKNSIKSDMFFNLDLLQSSENDSYTAKINIISKGYDAMNLRKKFNKDSKDISKELSSDNTLLLDSLRSANLHDLSKPFVVFANCIYSADKIEGKILIAPFCYFNITENPLKQSFRTYPIDMLYKRSKTFVTVLHIPKGYKLGSIPLNLSINNEEIKIQYQVETLDDQSIKVSGMYEFKKDVYDASSYIALKEYYNKIIDKFNEKIVLIKT